jgi:predicted ATPase
VLAHFFEGGRWGAFVQSTVEGQRLSEEDQLFPFWLPGAHIFRGWARSILGMPAEGLVWIEDGIREYRASGATLNMPYWLALKAEALQLVGRVVEALDTIKKAEARTCGH